MSTSVLSATHPPPQAGKATPAADDYVDPDTLRTTFALAMSAMYSAEVPLYSDLIRIVQHVNAQVLLTQQAQAQAQPPSSSSSSSPAVESQGLNDTLTRVTLERHGAIRLGTPQELHTASRIFALMGMRPVGYYDLSVAALPMHATCFRPITRASLATNPFRIFTTLLRPALLTPSARALATSLLARRTIFSPTLLDLLATAEGQERSGGRLTQAQGEVLVTEALRSFSWHPVAAATATEYAQLRAEHPILADIACFRAAHINHLTPRALDIDAAQRAMVAGGLKVKARIEGPPRRRCAVLLRQTSFLALEEGIRFPSGEEGEESGLVEGCHKARFGEIEERGAAVTAKGRGLYDQLLVASKAEGGEEGEEEVRFSEAFARVFPDSWDELRREKLIYCEYQCVEDSDGAKAKLASLDLDVSSSSASLLDKLVEHGVLRARPLTYEDFLPFSAAGIFQSNLQSKTAADAPAASPAVGGDREGYERALQCAVLDSDQLYAEAQRRSLETCAVELGLDVRIVAGLV